MSGCTKHGHQYDCAACVREQFAETLAEASIKRLKLAKRIEELEAAITRCVAYEDCIEENGVKFFLNQWEEE